MNDSQNISQSHHSISLNNKKDSYSVNENNAINNSSFIKNSVTDRNDRSVTSHA